jgi:phosphatidylethanolamine-binding protein (PEBP) family uncharacterized protein
MRHSRTTLSSLVFLTASTLSIGCAVDAAPDVEEANVTRAVSASNQGNHYGNADFAIWSPSFASGDALPSAFTCEGKPFGEGTSPELDFSKGPKGTKSYAIVFKDLSLVEVAPDFAFHWAIWDIPHSTHTLPATLPNEQFPAGLKGAQQYNAGPGDPFAYFGPCPSWQSLCFGAPRSNDSYAFTVYALADANVTLPADDPNISNRVREMSAYFESIALGKAELFTTSDARPSSFFLCPDAQ